MEKAGRCINTQESKITKDLSSLLDRLIIIDNEYLDIEKVYKASGDIGEKDLARVKDFNEEIKEMVTQGREMGRALTKMIELENPMPKNNDKKPR